MRLKNILLAAMLCAGFGGAATAQSAADLVEAEILPGWQMRDGTHMAALQITLKPGWKTYWRAPGDAGIPPQFDWRRSRNLTGVQPLWPAPRVISQGGSTAIGYSERLILPLRLQPSQTGREMRLAGTVEIGVCKDVCVPVKLRLREDIPLALAKPDPRIAAALAERPYSAEEAGVSQVACRMSPITDGIALEAQITMPGAASAQAAVIEVNDPMIWVAQPRVTSTGGRLVAQTQIYHVEGRAFALDRSGIRITVLGGDKTVDIQGCPAG